jgi:hypothetical protein
MKDNNKKSIKDNILDQLDPSLRKKYKSEIPHIFEELEKNEVFGQAIDQVFDECNNLNEIQSKLILIIKEHLKVSKKNTTKGQDGVDADEGKIAKDITEFCHTVMHNLDADLDSSLGKVSSKDRAHLLDIETKKNLKKIMKNFVVYEIYKIMNPKRIAGETVKDNYRHNLMEGGEKLAEKYEGGRESDLKNYGSTEITRMQQQATAFRKNGGSKSGLER